MSWVPFRRRNHILDCRDRASHVRRSTCCRRTWAKDYS
ncbi:hypothetical protein IEO21_07393 [Rhodonia placenta]|uniref:Uncharacterized protein n=1 Tax=Rhodonia placenta TaxID=104341 RepID=A0A8H7NYL8_9APHY|nr:hypothetical protein IEO21_07393 [Postia placenta]